MLYCMGLGLVLLDTLLQSHFIEITFFDMCDFTFLLSSYVLVYPPNVYSYRTQANC